MISIDNFSKNITKLLPLGEKNIQHMYGCRSCGYEGMLHRHGHYDRNVVTLTQHFVISIQRLLCPCCGKTYSLLPSFLIPYFIYTFDVVIFCLYCIYSLKKKSNYVCSILHDCNKQCFMSIKQYVLDAKNYCPQRSAKSIYHELIAKSLVSSNSISLSISQRFIKNHAFKASNLELKNRRAFEMEYPGDCWQTDISIGTYLTINGRKHKTYIIAYIDDASRAVMAYSFFFEQSLNAVLSVFKTAVYRRGIPKKLLMDNGKVFRSDQLQFICGSLGLTIRQLTAAFGNELVNYNYKKILIYCNFWVE